MDIVVQIGLGLAIGWRSLVALNQMGPATHHGIRVLHLVLATAGAWIAAAPLFPGQAAQPAMLVALGAYVALDRINRRRTLT